MCFSTLNAQKEQENLQYTSRMELHTLPKAPAQPLHHQSQEEQPRLGGWRTKHPIKKNQRKQPSENLDEKGSPRNVSSFELMPLPPPPLPFLVGKTGSYNGKSQRAVDFDQLYCGICTTTDDDYRTNFGDKTSSAKIKVQTPLPPPILPRNMMISGPPSLKSTDASGGENNPDFLYCGFISPGDSLNNPPINAGHPTTGITSDNSSSGESNKLSQASSVEMRSKLFVSGICCTTEVPIVRRILRPVPGVIRVDIQLISKIVTVHHCPNTVSTMQLAQALEDQGFPTKVVPNRSGDATPVAENYLGQMERSKFVVSTLSVNHEWSRENAQLLVEALRNEYTCNHKVRAIHPNPISKTIKIEHDPQKVSIDDIAELLAARCDIPLSVAVDGAVCNLYMPKDERDLETEDTNSTGSALMSWRQLMKDNPDFLAFHVLRCNVAMSGIFWILSLPSHFEVL